MCDKDLESEMQNPNKSNWVHLSENIVISPTGSHIVAKPTKKRKKFKSQMTAQQRMRILKTFTALGKLLGQKGKSKIPETY